jgi:NAD-dependent dihydropyrimidine dehydrogenase PreA subunit
MIVQVDPDKCQLCATCRLEIGCLGQVVERPSRQEPPVINEEQCYGCALCTDLCVHGAIIEK